MKSTPQGDEVYGIIRAAIRETFNDQIENESRVTASHGWWRVSLSAFAPREARKWVKEWMPMRRKTVNAFCRQLRAREWEQEFEG